MTKTVNFVARSRCFVHSERGSQRISRCAVGFADEVRGLRGQLNVKKGEIEIPALRDWLAKEIVEFSEDLINILFPPGNRGIFRSFLDDLFWGLKESLANSSAHAVREQGRVWVRWEIGEREAVFEIEDEGREPFDLSTQSQRKAINDHFDHPLAGAGQGLRSIRKCGDWVNVIPIRDEAGDLIGNKVVLKKYL